MNYRIQNTIRLLLVIILISSTALISKDNSRASHTITIVMPKIASLIIESVTANDITLTKASPSETGDPIPPVPPEMGVRATLSGELAAHFGQIEYDTDFVGHGVADIDPQDLLPAFRGQTGLFF